MSAESTKTSGYPSTPAYTARVNIWDTDPQTGKCGHASISLQKADVSNSLKLKKYMGLWPKYGWMVNLFTLPFTVPAEYHTSKKACMEREGDEGPIKPSKQFQIDLTPSQYEAMEEEMNRIGKKIENGTTQYTLFPNFNVFGFAKRIAKPSIMEQLHACPFTGLPMDHPTLIEDCQEITKIETDNCTTLAVKILNAGGIPVKRGMFPWALAPTTLGVQLERLRTSRPSV